MRVANHACELVLLWQSVQPSRAGVQRPRPQRFAFFLNDAQFTPFPPRFPPQARPARRAAVAAAAVVSVRAEWKWKKGETWGDQRREPPFFGFPSRRRVESRVARRKKTRADKAYPVQLTHPLHPPSQGIAKETMLDKAPETMLRPGIDDKDT